MTDLLQQGAAMVSAALQSYGSVQVTYTQTGSGRTATFAATPGSFLLKVTDPVFGIKIIRTDRDYLFPVANLAPIGAGVVPADGDTIDEVGTDGVKRRYQLLPYGRDEPTWRWSDRGRQLVRVHAKYVGVTT
jgi:hypothetical protein